MPDLLTKVIKLQKFCSFTSLRSKCCGLRLMVWKNINLRFAWGLESVKGERNEGRGRKGKRRKKKEMNQRDGGDFMTSLGA